MEESHRWIAIVYDQMPLWTPTVIYDQEGTKGHFFIGIDVFCLCMIILTKIEPAMTHR